MKNFKNIIFMLSIIIFVFDFNKSLLFLSKKNENNYIGVPTVFLYGNIEGMETKEDERIVGFNFLSKSVSFIKYAKIKIQGSSSLNYDKKNYTIKLYDTSDCEEEYEVDFGWGKENKYVMKANWIDKTHSRNIVSARIVSSVSKKYGLFENAPNNASIDGFPVEVYSDGEFLGLYTFNIPKADWMLGLDEDNENHLAFDAKHNLDQTYFYEEPTYDQWELEVGTENDENLDKLKRIYDFVNNSSDEEFKNSFKEYFNLDASLNYYVLSESLLFADNVAKNMILITYDGKVWYPVLYDLDASFGSNPYGAFLYKDGGLVNFGESCFWSRFRDVFWNEICDRYKELRKDILTTKNINKEIDLFYNSISKESFEKENDRWENIPGFDVSQMKEFVSKRFIYLDEYFN